MIAFLSGKIRSIDPQRVLLYVFNVGIGYEVQIANGHLTDVEMQAQVDRDGLSIWHVIREDGQTLFGFWTEAARELALRVAETHGVGPTTAARLVNDAGTESVLSAIAAGDAKLLSKLSRGLGPKRAEAIITQLKEYAETQMQGRTGMVRLPEQRRKIIERALVALGFTVIQQRLNEILEANLDVEDNLVVRAYIQQVVVRTS